MIIITGPTSSGKTSLGIKLAKELDMDIVSIDSRQMYKEFNYGTGKLPIDHFNGNYKITDQYWEIDGVKVYGYDLFNPCQKATVIDFAKKIKHILDNLDSLGRKYLLIGGTGFYIEFLCWYLTNNVSHNLSVDNNLLNEKYANLTKLELQQLLPVKILEEMNNSDKNNKYRLISRLKKKDGQGDINYVDPSIDHKLIVMTGANQFLYTRVDNWVDEIWPNLIAETQNLSLKYPDSPLLNGIVYKTAMDYINGIKSESDVILKTKFDLHGYIRRQKTWHKRYQNPIIIDISSPSLYNNIVTSLKI